MDDISSRRRFLQSLFDREVLLPSGVPGVFGHGSAFLAVLTALERLIDTACRPDRPEPVAFPPVIPRTILQKTGYMENFPQLCGSVHAFQGDDAAHRALVERVQEGGDWTPWLRQADVVLAPAGCYPVYPTLAGTLPLGGRLFDLTAHCFRHEPSDDPARMQAFRLRENVRAGTPDDVRAWRTVWMDRAPELLGGLQLDVHLDTASDPFFGRGGRMMKASQQAQRLKFELLVPIWPGMEPTAVASFNYHEDHFGHAFAIHSSDGECAHTACVGFGLDRISLALFHRHGLEPDGWPAQVRQRLWP